MPVAYRQEQLTLIRRGLHVSCRRKRDRSRMGPSAALAVGVPILATDSPVKRRTTSVEATQASMPRIATMLQPARRSVG
jgi:hypothetical protein